MKIKTFTATCLFIMALFTINTSTAQSIEPTTRNIEIQEGGMCETEITVYTNGYRAISKTYTTSDPNTVAITEVTYYELTSGVIRWLFNLMGKRCGYAVITTAIAFIDEYGDYKLIQETIHVSVVWDLTFRQAPSASTNIVIGDAIKEEDQP